MRRAGHAFALAGALCLALAAAPGARAAEAKAVVSGDVSGTLKKEVEDAVGVVKSRPSGPLEARRRAREAAVDALALLRSEGWYEASAEPEVSEADPPRAGVKVTLGQRFHFQTTAVAWVGDPPATEVAKAGVEAAALPVGAPGRAADVLAAEGRIVALLKKRGYADAEIKPRQVVVDFADRSVNPTFEIAAGALVRLGEIRLVRAGKTHPAFVRGLVPWKGGDVYTPEAVARLERILRDTQVYDSVTVSLAPVAETAGGLRPVLVNLSDRPGHTIAAGASYSTGQGSGVDATYSWYNRLGRADTLTLTAVAYDITQKLDLELDLPDWRRADQTLKVGGGFLGERTDAYDDLGGGVRAYVERHWTKTTYVTVGGSLDYASTKDTTIDNQGTPVGETLNLGIATVLAAVSLDRSNDPLNPVRGWRIQAQVEPTGILGDRQLVYLKSSAQGSVYYPLGAGAGTVLAARLKVGDMFGGSIPNVPADRRFYAGGGGSVRGYGYQAVGPRLSDNTPEGGISLVEASFEVRQRITRQWGVVAFVDAGSVSTTTTPQFKELSTGVGLGVRYDLGFGPLRLDVATPLNPREGDARVQVYISIGQAF